MAVVYFDTSALVKLVVREPGSELASALFNRADVVVTSRLADVEVRAVLTAGARAGLLDPAEHASALAGWERLWAALAVIEVGERITRDAAALLADTGVPLRADDAVHLAAACALRHPTTIIAAWDDRFAAAARAQGLSVLP